MSRVIENYLAVKSEVEAACSASGRAVDDVKLLVVSKTVPIPVLMELYDHGIREFAENRELTDVSIKDISVTAAKLLGLEPPREWEGKALV